MRCLMALPLVALLSSCASFRSGTLATGSPLLIPSEKPSISVVISGAAVISGESRDLPANLLDRWAEKVLEEYRSSAIFGTVRSGLYESDLRAEVAIENSGDPNQGLAFLCGLTLGLIPAKATDHLAMTTAFRNRDGDTLATITKAESVDTWMELFLIFVMPFKWNPTVVDQVFTDLVHETLAEAGSAGVFEASVPGA